MKKQTILITGGSKGYGAGIAEYLHNTGADVWITGRNKAALAATAERLSVRSIAGNVASGTDWDRITKTVLKASGRIDVLVNNAGAGLALGSIAEVSDASIVECVAVNLTGVMLGCRRVVPVMKRQGGGTIINISSICDRYAWPTWGPYSAAKAGVTMFSKCLYAEVREAGIRVTTLVPSWGQTDFIHAAAIPGHPSGSAGIHDKVTKPIELGQIVAQICALPAHLEIQELVVIPTVQEIMPL